MKIFIKAFIISVLLFTAGNAFSQDDLHYQKKAEMIFEIPKYLVWEFDENIENLTIGFYGSPQSKILKELKRISKKGYPNGTQISIIPFENVSQITKTHVLFVSYEYNSVVKSIREITKNNNTLLITDSYTSKKIAMVNFRPIGTDGLLIFEMNPDNIDNSGIIVNKRLYAIGGVDIDKRDLVEETESELQSEKDKVEKQRAEIKKQLAQIDEQTRKIKEQQNSINEQQRRIDEQQEKIDLQKLELQELLRQTGEQQAALLAKTQILEAQESAINQQKERLAEQRVAVEEQNRVLEGQKDEIKKQEKRIKDINSDLARQNLVIEAQKNLLTIFIVFFAVVIILIIFIFRAYRLVKNVNKELSAKNEEISAQKEEIYRQNIYTEAMNKQLEKLSIVARETRNAISVLDENGDFEWVNVGFTRLYGYTLQLWIHEKDANIRLADSNPNIKELFQTCIQTRDSISYESNIITRSGQEIWAQRTLTPLVDNQGKITKFALVDSDITEIKKAKLEIELQNDKILAQSHELELKNVELEKLSLVASKTDNSVIIFNADGDIEWVNDGFTRLLGVSLDDFVSKYGRNLFTSSLNTNIYDAVNESISTHRSVIYTGHTITSTGRELWIQTTLTPIYDNNDQVIKYIAIDSDVTKIKQAENEIARQKQQIMDSIIYARRIQSAVLPPTELIEKIFAEHLIVYRPKDIVSGDFYWIREIGDKIFVAVADSTGHGVPGALMSMLGVAFLNEIVNKQPVPHADQVLNELRDRVKISLRQTGKRNEPQDGMDIALMMIDKANMEIEFAGANNPLFIISGETQIELKADWMPIGIFIREKPFSMQTYNYNSGDLFYMFSDGFPDQFGGPDGKKFMLKRLKKALFDNKNLPLNEQEVLLNKALDDWQQGYRQMDDISVMGIRLM